MKLTYSSWSLVFTLLCHSNHLLCKARVKHCFRGSASLLLCCWPHIRWYMCVQSHIETLQQPLRPHSFMLGLGFNVWLGCWHITHMCSSWCQLVCLTTVKTGEVSTDPTYSVSLKASPRGRGWCDVYDWTVQDITPTKHERKWTINLLNVIWQDKNKNKLSLYKTFQDFVGKGPDTVVAPGSSRLDFLDLYSPISTSKPITLFYIMSNMWQAKQWVIQYLMRPI